MLAHVFNKCQVSVSSKFKEVATGKANKLNAKTD